MNDLVVFCLIAVGLPVFLLLIVLCSQECLHQQFRPRQQEQRQPTTQQHVRGEQSVDPNDIERHEQLESISYRPHVGYVLKSTIDSYEESHDETKEQELPAESRPNDDPFSAATDILDQHDSSTASSFKNTHLSVDFGDFEILPLEETSCSICLLEYEHGEIVQRNASNGLPYHCSTRRSHQNSTATNQSLDMNQCDHIFHKNCITKWMKSNVHHECPICRRAFCDGGAIPSRASIM